MAELKPPAGHEALEKLHALDQSRSPRARRQGLLLKDTDHEVLQSVVRKHIIRKRWYALLNIILLRLRQQKMGTCAASAAPIPDPRA